ncbi:MAG: hypothetical protein J6U98_07655 [Abditibacteriota bacterium]|nr:hypothetical protein [Abditibacteriota bacterium]MBP5092645.1 hypothetical protein [Abditibacteriota bacterium]MBP5739239.1 hypothetical protein [Abditibacteriota bacterium]
MSVFSPMAIITLLGFLLCSSFGQICMKLGMKGEEIPIEKSPFKTIINIILVMLRPYTLTGFVLYVIGALSWLMFLSRVPLNVAYPMISIGYVAIMVLSGVILKEKINWRYASAALVCIAVGVCFIGYSLH